MSFAPITSPNYVDMTPYPYIRGPIYTRPIFKEQGPGGNFVIQPIIRMPALGDSTTSTTDQPTVTPTPASICAAITGGSATAYQNCLTFNQNMAAAQNDPTQMATYKQMMAAADAKCSGNTDPAAYAECYYAALVGSKWYYNPVYLGAIALGAAALVAGAFALSHRAVPSSETTEESYPELE